MPIRRAPDLGNAGQLALLLANVRFEAQVAEMAITVEMINHGKARVFPVIIHAADVHEEIEAQFLFRKGANLTDPFAVRNQQRYFTAKFGRL